MNIEKYKKLLAIMQEAPLDAVALVPGPNFRLLLGREFHLMERPFLVFIGASAHNNAAIVPNLEMASFDTLGFEGQVFDWRDESGYQGAFEAACAMLASPDHLGRTPRIGIEGQRMRAFEYLGLKQHFEGADFIDAHQEISKIRLIKTADDIANLRKAIGISEAALEATLAEVRVGQSEKEIESILLRQLFAHGAHGLSFDPIVAAGENSAQPHATARADYFVQKGDALLIDFGASYNGYNADITRTFFIEDVSDFDRAFYETVLAANARGRDVSHAGKSAHDIDDAVQKVLEQSQFAEFKRHKTGHGLGLDVHEAPQIMRGNHTTLETGMVYTIEPGLYRMGECGVRIEDDVVLTEHGMDCLTTFSRDLRVVG